MNQHDLQYDINLILAKRDLELILAQFNPELTAEDEIAIEDRADHQLNAMCRYYECPLFIVDGELCYSPGERNAMLMGDEYDTYTCE